jgi:hypothetical protein
MIPKSIDDITEIDLQLLIKNCVCEKRTIEYKQLLTVDADRDRKEFLADVSSFANANGGDLIIGISENDGIPGSLVGIEVLNKDENLLRLENMIRDGIEPRLPSINIRQVDLSSSKTVIIVRIGNSWLSPHRVTFKGHDKFYSRSSNGKYALDVSELRTAFTLADSFAEKIRRFREERVSRILADETPVPFSRDPKIVLHLIPFASLKSGEKIEIHKISANPGMLPPICSTGWDGRYNLDGYVTYSYIATEKADAYTQLYRNGIVEAVNGNLIRKDVQGVRRIPNVAFENKLIESLGAYLRIYRDIEIQPPVILFLTLLGVRGCTLHVDEFLHPFFRASAIDRDIVLLPEVIIEDLAAGSDQLLKPCFDAVWNACGYAGSANYDPKSGQRLKGS